MKKFFLWCFLFVLVNALAALRLQAQTAPVLDTLLAEENLRIVAPTLQNLITLINLNQAGFEQVLLTYGYLPDTTEAKGTFKIESSKATYNIHKNKYEVEFCYPPMPASLNKLKADVKILYPKAKVSPADNGGEIYDFKGKPAAGQHVYMLNIDPGKASVVNISLVILH